MLNRVLYHVQGAAQEIRGAARREHLFAFLSRNAQRATVYFRIPANQVVEIGIEVEI